MAYLGTKPANQIVDSTLIADGTVTPADLSTGKPVWDTSGNVGIGTSSPSGRLDVLGSVASTSDWGNVNITSRNAINAANRIYTAVRLQDSGSGDAGAIGYSYNGTGYNMMFATVPTVGGAITERMRIDSTGRVTMPAQPAFRAFTGTTFTGNTTVIFGSTQFNTGGHYSTSTGRFTAPIAGRYFFTFYLLNANSSPGSFWGGLRINGTSLAFAEMDWSGLYKTITASTVVQLAAGDYVDVQLAQGANYATGSGAGEWNAFSGYLIG